jgi:uncharacterized membrane protein
MAKKSIKLSDIPDTIQDDNDVNPQEMSVMNEIFRHEKKATKNSVITYTLYATALFIVLSTPFTDRIIELAFPMTCSWLILLGAKAVVFFLMYYLILTSVGDSKKKR